MFRTSPLPSGLGRSLLTCSLDHSSLRYRGPCFTGYLRSSVALLGRLDRSQTSDLLLHARRAKIVHRARTADRRGELCLHAHSSIPRPAEFDGCRVAVQVRRVEVRHSTEAQVNL